MVSQSQSGWRCWQLFLPSIYDDGHFAWLISWRGEGREAGGGMRVSDNIKHIRPLDDLNISGSQHHVCRIIRPFGDF